MSKENQTGAVSWRDLTVKNADEVQRFYCEVVGWKSTPHNMGEYHDFNMIAPAGGETVAGICHARGVNADIPPQWLIYITVENVQRSADRCVELGGKIVAGPRSMGGGQICVIQDPAGAMAALYSP